MKKKETRKKVFVTYSWGDDTHNQRVIAFTNFLRQNGFEADVDRSISNDESAINFQTMMTKNIVSSEKVIVILSKEYKEKADLGKGGVGKEYEYILSCIDSEKNKFILVSFSKVNKKAIDEIAPLGFKSRDIVDLVDDESKKFERLFSKLLDTPTIKLADVSNSLPHVNQQPIPVFTLVNSVSNTNFGDHRIKPLLAEWSTRLVNDSYFESYHTAIECEYSVVNKVLVIKKRVKSTIVLTNPMDDFLEEANFFSMYKFAKIKGVKDEFLLKLLKLEITIDNERKKNLTSQVIITKAKNRIKAYRNNVTFQYKINSGGFLSNIIFPFKKRIIIELEEERLVPRNDLIYLKEFNKLTKDFSIEYSFPDLKKGLNGTFVSSLVDRINVQCKSSQNGKGFSLRNSSWFLPGDGVFIFVED